MHPKGLRAATGKGQQYRAPAAVGVLFAAVLLSAFAAALVLSAPASAQAEGDEPKDTAMMRVVQLSPDAPESDVYLDGKPDAVVQGVEFGGVSAYFPVPAGAHELKIYATGENPESSEPVLETGADLRGGGWYTVAGVGLLEEGSLGVRLFEDDHTPSEEGKAKLRVVHAAPNVGPATVEAKAEGEEAQKPLFAIPGFSNASPYAELSAGTYDLELKPAGTTEAALTVSGTTLAEGETRTIFLAEGASEGSLEALPAVDREGGGDDEQDDGGDSGKRKSDPADAPEPRSPAVNGTADDNSLRGTGRADVIHGKGGDDALHGLGGDDALHGGGGHDGLYGGPGNDELRGGAGDDRTRGRPVHGGSGDDTIWGKAGEDAVYAGRGDDTVYSVGDGEGDLVDCGPGTDTVGEGSDSDLDRFVGCERFGE
jgi:Ca2+-binding RTX toxin-like protein